MACLEMKLTLKNQNKIMTAALSRRISFYSCDAPDSATALVAEEVSYSSALILKCVGSSRTKDGGIEVFG